MPRSDGEDCCRLYLFTEIWPFFFPSDLPVQWGTPEGCQRNGEGCRGQPYAKHGAYEMFFEKVFPFI